MTLKVLSVERAACLQSLCEAIVPGCTRAGPVVYVDALLRGMPPQQRDVALHAIDALAPAAVAGTLAQVERTPDFALLRALAIEAFYSDFVAPGYPGPGAWKEIDFEPPRAVDLERDWSYLEAP